MGQRGHHLPVAWLRHGVARGGRSILARERLGLPRPGRAAWTGVTRPARSSRVSSSRRCGSAWRPSRLACSRRTSAWWRARSLADPAWRRRGAGELQWRGHSRSMATRRPTRSSSQPGVTIAELRPGRLDVVEAMGRLARVDARDLALPARRRLGRACRAGILPIDHPLVLSDGRAASPAAEHAAMDCGFVSSTSGPRWRRVPTRRPTRS